MIRAFLWDLDGTLINSEGYYERALIPIFEENGLRVKPADFTGLSLKAMYDSFLCCEKEAALEAYAAFEHRVLNDILRAIHSDLKQGTVENLILKDSYKTLLFAQAQGIEQAIVTNSPRSFLDGILELLNFKDFFKHTISASEVQNPKPHPEPYLNAMTFLRLSPQECVVLEDSLPGAIAGLESGASVLLRPQDPSVFVRAQDLESHPRLKLLGVGEAIFDAIQSGSSGVRIAKTKTNVA